jgi:hypothetical protein
MSFCLGLLTSLVQGASSYHKIRIVKHRFKDQEDNTGNEGAGEASAAPAQAPSLVGKAGARGAKKKTT